MAPQKAMMQENHNKKTILKGAIFPALLITALIAVVYFYFDKKEIATEKRPIINTFAGLAIEGKSAYVYDLKRDKILFAKEPELQLPLASITKVMSALVALEKAPEDMSVKTSSYLLPERGGGDIRGGEVWKLKDLIKFSLVSSSNDGASAIASAIGSLNSADNAKPQDAFVTSMNRKAREIGLYQTFFVNSSGLDLTDNFSGSYGSARDAAMLISYAYRNYSDVMEATSYPLLSIESLSGIRHNVENTNVIAKEVAGLVASKTGFTDLAGGNLAVVFEAGPSHPIAIVVLGSSKEGRFEDMKKLYDATLKYIKKNYE